MGQLVELPRATLADVPNVLRNIADCMEQGKYGDVVSAVLIVEGDNLEVFWAGAADFYRALALFRLAEHHLIKR